MTFDDTLGYWVENPDEREPEQTQYAVASLMVHLERRYRPNSPRPLHRQMRVCEWPRDDWEQAVLLDGPFDTLLEAQDAMRRRVIPALQAYEIWSEPAA